MTENKNTTTDRAHSPDENHAKTRQKRASEPEANPPGSSQALSIVRGSGGEMSKPEYMWNGQTLVLHGDRESWSVQDDTEHGIVYAVLKRTGQCWWFDRSVCGEEGVFDAGSSLPRSEPDEDWMAQTYRLSAFNFQSLCDCLKKRLGYRETYALGEAVRLLLFRPVDDRAEDDPAQILLRKRMAEVVRDVTAAAIDGRFHTTVEQGVRYVDSWDLIKWVVNQDLGESFVPGRMDRQFLNGYKAIVAAGWTPTRRVETPVSDHGNKPSDAAAKAVPDTVGESATGPHTATEAVRGAASTPEPSDEFLTLPQALLALIDRYERLGIESSRGALKNRIWRACKKGGLVSHGTGRARRIRRADFDAWILHEQDTQAELDRRRIEASRPTSQFCRTSDPPQYKF